MSATRKGDTQQSSNTDTNEVDNFLKEFGSFVQPGQMDAFRLFTLQTRQANLAKSEGQEEDSAQSHKPADAKPATISPAGSSKK
jgi:hypothetical protein